MNVDVFDNRTKDKPIIRGAVVEVQIMEPEKAVPHVQLTLDTGFNVQIEEGTLFSICDKVKKMRRDGDLHE